MIQCGDFVMDLFNLWNVDFLDGGLKYFVIFTPSTTSGEMIQFDLRIFFRVGGVVQPPN